MVVVCLCALATWAWPIEARQTIQATDAETFRQRLLEAFARGDRRAVAGMVRYRLVVDAGGMMVPVVDRATLIQLWDVVFPPEVRCLIEHSEFQRPGQPKPKHEITVDAGGAWFGDGRIRADRGADGLKITRMTLPPGFGTGAAGKPRQVLFKWGKGRAIYRGRLSADNIDVYLVQARAVARRHERRRVPASRPAWTRPRIARLGIRVSKHVRVVIVIRSAHLLQRSR